MSYGNKNQNYASEVSVCSPKRETLRERLEEQKRQAEDHLANLNSALEFMDKNPQFETFHNTISKAGF